MLPLHLQVEEGEIFGFLGSNGAGKTTTLKLLMGLSLPDRGFGPASWGWKSTIPALKRRSVFSGTVIVYDYLHCA